MGQNAVGQHGMVVSAQADASAAGLEMLEAGGNAVDAAVAAAFAIGVTQPFSTGIGGGAFVLIRLADATGQPGREGHVIAIDARETAPATATEDMYVRPGVPERASIHSPLAVATPGLVAGLAMAVENFGTLPLSRVLEPAIRLAEEGYPIGPYQVGKIERMRAYLTPDRFPETARIQFPPPGQEAEPGWRLVQKDLAATLRVIAEKGPDGFYKGRVARAIARTMEEQGGLVSEEDLASYRAVPRVAISGSYRGVAVHSFPPPSSGGVVLVEMLNLLEGFALGVNGAEGGMDAPQAHRIVEAMKLGFADRAAYMGDPDFIDVPVARLTSRTYGNRQRRRISRPWYRRAPWRWLRSRDRAITVEGPGLPSEDSGTSHLSVTDSRGNAVALSQTINTTYGSGITVPGTGILLNNEMDDFAVAPGTPNVYGLIDTRGANAIAPGKRPLSSMTPTILERDGVVVMVTGSPGGPRIITTVLHNILNVLDFEMDVQHSVAAPRFHMQWVPDVVYAEPGVPAEIVEGLRARGHTVEQGERNWSNVQAIVIDPATGAHHGGADPRGDGLALGYSPEPQ
ncbi:MAG: gamma-glutamyltransferase [Proteobacteria bacterium]|nr:gamma-glutamyltransferase [Pseudomonadota bacterium]